MKTVLILISVAVALVAGDVATVEGQKARVADLQEKVTSFRANLNKRIDAAQVLESEIDTVRDRLRSLEPSGCDDRFELQCGGDHPKCVSRLLVCDLHKDCDNGRDEEECDILTPSGSLWRGTVVYDNCTKRKPKTISVYIDNYKVFDYFRPFPQIDAHIATDDDAEGYSHANDLEVHGWMDLKPGNHILYLQPPENDGLALACVFDGKDNERCHGQILHESSQEVCAEFYAVRSDAH